MDTDNATVVINKPDSVLMRFYDNDTELVAGSTVKLGHKLNMRLEVVNNVDGKCVMFFIVMLSFSSS